MCPELVRSSLATNGVAGGQHKDYGLPEAEAKKRLNQGDKIKRTWGQGTDALPPTVAERYPLPEEEANASKDTASL
jgi:hypothetical protein